MPPWEEPCLGTQSHGPRHSFRGTTAVCSCRTIQTRLDSTSHLRAASPHHKTHSALKDGPTKPVVSQKDFIPIFQKIVRDSHEISTLYLPHCWVYHCSVWLQAWCARLFETVQDIKFCPTPVAYRSKWSNGIFSQQSKVNWFSGV